MSATKNKILEAAAELFNRSGTSHVSTNHIAEAAGISPGNLYYHYTDKGHIIRAIYEQMIEAWEVIYKDTEDEAGSLHLLQTFVSYNFHLLWRYRFFYRESVALINADPDLKNRHLTVTQQRYKQQHQLLLSLIEAEVLRPDAPVGTLLTTSWIVANHYLNHLEMMGDTVDEASSQLGLGLVMSIFAPYINK